MQAADKGSKVNLDGRELRVGLVRARFNAEVTEGLSRSCRSELAALGVHADDTVEVTVPGALEIGVALAALARSGRFDALVALGCIIRGETYHFELVANESGAAVTRVALDHHIPIANAVLTVETPEQALARTDEKGRDAARVAVEMARLMDELS
jgi:6,7-dimethyl-8-ribityllumazine synthase